MLIFAYKLRILIEEHVKRITEHAYYTPASHIRRMQISSLAGAGSLGAPQIVVRKLNELGTQTGWKGDPSYQWLFFDRLVRKTEVVEPKNKLSKWGQRESICYSKPAPSKSTASGSAHPQRVKEGH